MTTNSSGTGQVLVQLQRQHGLTKRYATVVMPDDSVKNSTSGSMRTNGTFQMRSAWSAAMIERTKAHGVTHGV